MRADIVLDCVAIVGASGAVGRELLAVLEQRRFPLRSLRLLASPRSAGRTVQFFDRACTIETLRGDSLRGVQLALFSAGAAVSREFAPAAARSGTVVVDNSSAFRADPNVPLVVPEVNAGELQRHAGIIANPNCSTIILAVPLWPLHRRYGVRRVVVCTYQAASGAGARAMDELVSQTRTVLSGGEARPEIFSEPCAFNVFSHNSAVGADGLNVEERKMISETRRIFGNDSIAIAPTCMRVPVLRAHTEAVSVEFREPVELEEVRRILAEAPGVRLVDDPGENRFPTPLRASGGDEILVGRLRLDPSVADGRGLQFICAGDQLRKGAALNAVQIAERLFPAAARP
ncbi:MAG: aspartate-semialdehyde dehydrogenase [Phycisphaerae bacterium]|jgi:aspartate-semialdehyde dehydrogenase